nr:hypothetical protein [Tanacetum cinerariifolium]
MPSIISHWMVARVMAGVSDVDVLLGGILSTYDDPTDEDGDTEVLVSLGEISSKGNKSWESDIGDCDNTRDGGKTAGRAIISWGGEIALYACMASIYGSSCKREKISIGTEDFDGLEKKVVIVKVLILFSITMALIPICNTPILVILLACSIQIGWAYAFHQDKASLVIVPVGSWGTGSSPSGRGVIHKEEKLWDEFYRLETSRRMWRGVCDAATFMERKKEMWPFLGTRMEKIFPSAPKATPVTKPVAAKQSKTKHAPAKTQKKKCKLVTKTSDEPSPAKISKPGEVTKRHKPTSSLSLVDKFVDEGIPEREPRFDDEEVNVKKAVEKSLKSVHDAHRGPLSSVVIREPDSGKFQPLPEVQGKGKEKVSDEQVALDLLTLQTPKKVSPAEQYIFQRHTPTPTEPLGHVESLLIYAELGLTNSDTESDEELPLEAGSNPVDDAEPQPQSSHVFHDGPDLEHMDLEATNVST